MKPSTQLLENEQYIKNAKGELEFVVIPVSKYKKIIEMIEDHGLGLAIKEAENEKLYSKDEALRYLDDA
jgi:hypothetical protein